jgi:hypothetical protein
MLQESTTVQWDPIYIYRDPGIAFRIYLLFLVVPCVVTVSRLVRVWRVVLPFTNKRASLDSAYLRLLQVSTNGIKRWIGLVCLAWGLLTSAGVYHACGMMYFEKNIRGAAILLWVQDFSVALSMALSVVVFLYLVRWYLLVRTERFHD